MAVDHSAAMNTTLLALASNLSLQNSITGLGIYDGSNVPLKDFLQDVNNGEACVAPEQKAAYLRAVLTKLRGPAKDCTYGQTFNTIEDLCSRLKQRFAPGKDFTFYNSKLYALKMRQGDTVGSFNDQINILINCARSALKEEKGQRFNEDMLTPLTEASIDIFIRGLPGNLGAMVDNLRPKTLDEAYKEAVRLEARMDAHVIPDARIRGAQRAHDQDSYRYPNRRPYFDEEAAYVGWNQEESESHLFRNIHF